MQHMSCHALPCPAMLAKPKTCMHRTAGPSLYVLASCPTHCSLPAMSPGVCVCFWPCPPPNAPPPAHLPTHLQVSAYQDAADLPGAGRQQPEPGQHRHEWRTREQGRRPRAAPLPQAAICARRHPAAARHAGQQSIAELSKGGGKVGWRPWQLSKWTAAVASHPSLLWPFAAYPPPRLAGR